MPAGIVCESGAVSLDTIINNIQINKVTTLGKQSFAKNLKKYLQLYLYVKVIVNQCIKVIVIRSRCMCPPKKVGDCSQF